TTLLTLRVVRLQSGRLSSMRTGSRSLHSFFSACARNLLARLATLPINGCLTLRSRGTVPVLSILSLTTRPLSVRTTLATSALSILVWLMLVPASLSQPEQCARVQYHASPCLPDQPCSTVALPTACAERIAPGATRSAHCSTLQ